MERGRFIFLRPGHFIFEIFDLVGGGTGARHGGCDRR